MHACNYTKVSLESRKCISKSDLRLLIVLQPTISAGNSFPVVNYSIKEVVGLAP